jgi:hypothetical protein
LTYPSEKYDFVSWDDEIPNIWKIKVMFQTTNQDKSWCFSLIHSVPIKVAKLGCTGVPHIWTNKRTIAHEVQ